MASKPRQIHLLIIQDDKGRQEYPLEGSLYSIGRDPSCNIRLVSHFVSRHHATLKQVQNDDGTRSYQIVDGNFQGKPSSNGIFVNGRKLQRCSLQHEDKIVFGPEVYAVYYLLKRDAIMTIPPGEFDDITLINPRTAGKLEDATSR
jgi:pSer/pThr/pTyr-binding forkhead associated (FHA) protein